MLDPLIDAFTDGLDRVGALLVIASVNVVEIGSAVPRSSPRAA
jgi:hypothetical protein